MITKNKFFITTASALVLVLTAACSSVQKADIPTTANPQIEVRKFDDDMREAVTNNVDILAADEYKKAAKYRDEAKSDLAKGEKQEEVLDDVRKGRGYLNAARSTAHHRSLKAPDLLEARQMALQAGAWRHPELREDLEEADSDVVKNASDLSEISADKMGRLQQSYINLEKRAVIANQLGNAKAILNGAKKDGAMSSAPVTYKRVEVSINSAEAIIATNVRSEQSFRQTVANANSDATYLNEVMTAIKQNKNLSESAAVKMVSQNRQIKNLKTDLSAQASANVVSEWQLQNKNNQMAEDMDAQGKNLKASEQSLADKEADIAVMQGDMDSKDKDLSSAQATVEVQRALEEARSKFSSDEAEAYQQGGNLVIRLKKINFASGRSELPSASLASLAKVTEVAKSLNASEIKVEGHTDSVGAENINKSISEKRADVVATYFKSNGFNDINVMSEGYGFQKPIATNKSKEGRAQNRRVDIVITPKVEQ